MTNNSDPFALASLDLTEPSVEDAVDAITYTAELSIVESDTVYESTFAYAKHAEDILGHYSIDMSSFSSWDSGIAAAQEALLLQGAVILKNTGFNDLSELHKLCSPFGALMDYIGGTNDRANQGKGVLNVGTEPPWANVSAHNEMSYSNLYPEIFIIGCKSAPEVGGCTVIADNQLITRSLMQTAFGEKLRTLGVRYIRNFHDATHIDATGPSFTSWQQVFGTEDFEEAIARARIVLGGNQTCDIETTAKGGLRMMYNAPAFEYDPETQTDMCFMSIGNHGYWFRQWPPHNELAHMDRPWHLQYGDGTEFSERDLALFAKITNQHGYPIQWTPGDIAILKNRRFMHARPAYSLLEGQTRELGVLLMNSTHRVGQMS